MVYEAVRQISRTAAADIAIRRFVEQTTGAKVQQVGTAGNSAIGVSMEAADVSEGIERIPVGLLDGGRVEVEAGAAVTQNALVMSDNQGRAVAATSGNAALGYADTAAGAAGEIITVLTKALSVDFP